MRETPLLSALRQPPEVGRFYMVPVITAYPWHNRIRDWPVLGPLHEDLEFFRFGTLHYHVDLRFLSVHDYAFASGHIPRSIRSGVSDIDAALNASASPLCSRGSELPKGRPMLQRRRCRRAGGGTTILNHIPAARESMETRFGSPAQPIRLADGRLLCPHRKVDLSQFAADDQGIVTCPLHGLRVHCGVPA